MPVYSVWMLEKQNITVSGGGSLDDATRGDGSQLVGRTLTLDRGDWRQTLVRDNDGDFEDNDNSQQTLAGPQTINGITYATNTRVEAEYRIVLRNPATGEEWTAYGYNVLNSNPSFATVEGLVLKPNATGSYPPIGVALTVLGASEGPVGRNSNPYDLYSDPPCFTPGTLIDTACGPRPVESLRAGDMVVTRDNGLQPLRWIGSVRLTAADLRARPELAPVRIRRGALGDGLPRRPLELSPQHRVLFSGWRSELLFALPEVLVPAAALLDDRAERPTSGDGGVTYLHLLLDCHEILFAEGAPVESLLPAWLTATDIPKALRDELALFLPEGPGRHGGRAVLPCLTMRESRVLAS